jgi:ATP-dependent helicase/nuclease subunit A
MPVSHDLPVRALTVSASDQLLLADAGPERPAPPPAAARFCADPARAATLDTTSATTAAAGPRSALTSAQEQAAARRQGPLLLAAGAGSGKTSVLVERFVRAVREDGIAPGRILAITFTERAAAELRGRVRARLLELGEREAARDTEGAPIGTFHGFCARLLRIHALSAGLDPEFVILDEPGAGRLQLLAFRRALAALLAESGVLAKPGTLAETGTRAGGECLPAAAGERREQAIDLLAAYGADRTRDMVLGVYAEQRSRGVNLPVLPDPARAAPAWGALAQPAPPAQEQEAIRACALLGALLEEFGRGYAELKRAHATLDFDDLELYARDLLARDAGVRESWAERIELLMVDEFQDTNRRQLALLTLLERDNLFTVGDELQSIYGFRHAEVEIFRERRRELQAAGATIALAHNFRSRPPLIAAVNEVFAERFGDAHTPLIAMREGGGEEGPLAATGMLAGGECLPATVDTGTLAGGERLPAAVELLLTDKRAWSEQGLADRPLGVAVSGALPPATLWRQAEARLLAQRVAELVDGGHAAAGDVAILLRAAGDLPVYERALEERGLRTLAAVGSFWGHQQIGDLLAWLRALANPLDELALYSVLASPLVGISSDGLALVALQARAAGADVWATVAGSEGELYTHLTGPDRERLAGFAEHFAAELRAVPTHGAAELLLRVIAHSGYERHVLSLPWGERRMANVHKLLRLTRRFQAREGRGLRALLDHLEHRGAGGEGSEPHAPTGSEPDAVRLMTIHAAKGLEFPVVCVADLGRTGNGSPPDLLVDGERIGLRLARLDGSPPVGSLHYEELYEERRRAQAAEEERILYVAMTRARERLLLSGSCDFERWPAVRPGVTEPGAEHRGGGAPTGGAPIVWLTRALVPELPALASTLERPITELRLGANAAEGNHRSNPSNQSPVMVRCWLNAPATVGAVLREESLRPVALQAAGTAPARVERPAVPERSAASEGSDIPMGSAVPEGSDIPRASNVPEGSDVPRRSAVPERSGVPEESAPAAPPPVPLNYTALSELERCGYRYYLERVLGLPENRAAGREHAPASGSLRARSRGVLVHKLLESFDFAHPHPSNEARPNSHEVAGVARELGIAVSPHEREELATLVQAAARTPLAERLRRAERVHHEHPFAFILTGPERPVAAPERRSVTGFEQSAAGPEQSMAGLEQPMSGSERPEQLASGTVDLLAYEPGGDWLVVDYKSDRVSREEDLEQLVEREYGVQRLLYALAALHGGAPAVEVVHWFLERPGESVGARFRAEERDALLEQLHARAQRAHARGFAVSETPHRGLCLTCPGRARLCSWNEADTLRERPAAESGAAC